VNLVTGRSNFITFVDCAVDLVIASILWTVLRDIKMRVEYIPLDEIGWVYVVRSICLIVDSFVLVCSKVLNILDVLNIAVDLVFWVYLSLWFDNFENHHELLNILV
jgi:hypothetical protein